MPIYALSDSSPHFPPPSEAEPDGLLAIGGDLSMERLLLAYCTGIFPWYSEGSPLLWWSPDPRCVLFPQELHRPKSLAKTLRKKNFRCTVDEAFEQVIAGCAFRGQATPAPSGRVPEPAAKSDAKARDNTWLVPEMIEAYTSLHRLGFAHSVEVWSAAGLAGGLYGLCLGGIFFGESMFHSESDASKAALLHLVDFLTPRGVFIIDCQQETDNLIRFGARPIPREDFLRHVASAVAMPVYRGSWARWSL